MFFPSISFFFALADFLAGQAKTLEQIQTSFPLNKSGVEARAPAFVSLPSVF
jgi:hypothetical protein